jgi:hypothetical protein
VIERPQFEARKQGHSRVDLEHLLLGLTVVADGPVAQVLAGLEIQQPDVRGVGDALSESFLHNAGLTADQARATVSA